MGGYHLSPTELWAPHAEEDLSVAKELAKPPGPPSQSVYWPGKFGLFSVPPRLNGR